MDFSVIIPTFNRSHRLLATLAGLAHQRVEPVEDRGALCCEVIVVDDGSSDDTPQRVAELCRTYPVALRYLRQANRKQGAARNLGAGEAAGDLLVFLGDDTIPTPDFLAEHWKARSTRGEAKPDSRLAVIGYTPWAPHLARTRFMEYVGEQGWQFGFSLISDPEDVPFNFFYTSNLSLSRRFFQTTGGFDESFQEYGWEDIELSVRLKKAGMKLVFNRSAVAVHDHPTSLSAFVARQKRVGYSAWHFYQRHPELAEFLSVLRARPYSLSQRTRMAVLTALCALTEKRNWPDLTHYYPDLMSYYYNVGILQGRNEQG